MNLTARQLKAIRELEDWGEDERAGTPVPLSEGLKHRMADLQFEEIPLSDLMTPESTEADFVAGPGATTSIRLRSAKCKITLKDRTGWPVKGATVEIWSQAIGRTNAEGVYESPFFFSGQYPIKIRAKFIGFTTGGPRDPVLPFEFSKIREFPAEPSAFEFQIQLSASGLDIDDRISQVFWRTLPLLSGEAKNQLKQLISPESIAIFAVLVGLWAAGHLVAVGEIADAIALAAIMIKLGLNVALATAVAHDLIAILTTISVGKTEFDLDEAAQAFARVITTVGLVALMAVLGTVVKKATKNPGEYRPKGAKPENAVEPPNTSSVTEAASSPLGKKLGTAMGKDVLQERLQAVEECAKRDPTLKDIPREDLASLRGYTSDAVTELGKKSSPVEPVPDYKVMNRALRAQDPKAFGAVAEYLDSALRAFNRLPKLRCKSERCIDLRPPDASPKELAALKKLADSLRAGKVYKDRGFSSSSTSPRAAGNFGGAKTMRFKIQGYSGRNVAKLSELPREAEVLYRPGTRFFITSKKVKGNVIEVTMFEIRQDAHEFVAVWGKGQTLLANLKSFVATSLAEKQKSEGQ
jgi:hypothetical protein